MTENDEKAKLIKTCQEKWALLQIKRMIVESNGMGKTNCDYLKPYCENPHEHSVYEMSQVNEHLDRHLASTGKAIERILSIAGR